VEAAKVEGLHHTAKDSLSIERGSKKEHACVFKKWSGKGGQSLWKIAQRFLEMLISGWGI
jgi:hypothetical protein